MKRTKQDYEKAAEESLSIAQMCRLLGLKAVGGNYKTIHNKIIEYNIDTSHFTGQGWNINLQFKPNPPIPIENILVNGSTYQSFKLKLRLLKENIKEYKCECCQRVEWNEQPIPLEVHHVNGINNDHRIENLQLLCPNCHAQTNYYRGKKHNE